MDEAKTTIEVGGDLRSFTADVGARWKAAVAGKPVDISRKIVFQDWDALCSVLTPKRYEMLRALHATPAAGVRALARALGRDVKNVHADIIALEEIGLVVRGDDGTLTAPAAAITSTIHFAAA